MNAESTDHGPRPIVGNEVRQVCVGAWTPTPDGSGKPTAVGLSFVVAGVPGDLLVRIKSRDAVDRMISQLARYRDEVWPAIPLDLPERTPDDQNH